MSEPEDAATVAYLFEPPDREWSAFVAARHSLEAFFAGIAAFDMDYIRAFDAIDIRVEREPMCDQLAALKAPGEELDFDECMAAKGYVRCDDYEGDGDEWGPPAPVDGGLFDDTR